MNNKFYICGNNKQNIYEINYLYFLLGIDHFFKC